MENKIKELTDFYMWMVKNEYDHNIRSRVENKAEIYLKSVNSSPCERKVDSNNEQTQEECDHDPMQIESGSIICRKVGCGKILYK